MLDKAVDTSGAITVDRPDVGCDGGGGALGHPLVWLTLAKGGKVDCPYCGRCFVLSGSARSAPGDH